MSRLERVFLMNVSLFIETIQDLIQFQLVNKKCLEALNGLHINPFIKDFDVQHPNKNEKGFVTQCLRISSFLMKSFPRLETLVCTYAFLRESKDDNLFSRVQMISVRRDKSFAISFLRRVKSERLQKVIRICFDATFQCTFDWFEQMSSLRVISLDMDRLEKLKDGIHVLFSIQSLRKVYIKKALNPQLSEIIEMIANNKLSWESHCRVYFLLIPSKKFEVSPENYTKLKSLETMKENQTHKITVLDLRKYSSRLGDDTDEKVLVNNVFMFTSITLIPETLNANLNEHGLTETETSVLRNCRCENTFSLFRTWTYSDDNETDLSNILDIENHFVVMGRTKSITFDSVFLGFVNLCQISNVSVDLPRSYQVTLIHCKDVKLRNCGVNRIECFLSENIEVAIPSEHIYDIILQHNKNVRIIGNNATYIKELRFSNETNSVVSHTNIFTLAIDSSSVITFKQNRIQNCALESVKYLNIDNTNIYLEKDVNEYLKCCYSYHKKHKALPECLRSLCYVEDSNIHFDKIGEKMTLQNSDFNQITGVLTKKLLEEDRKCINHIANCLLKITNERTLLYVANKFQNEYKGNYRLALELIMEFYSCSDPPQFPITINTFNYVLLCRLNCQTVKIQNVKVVELYMCNIVELELLDVQKDIIKDTVINKLITNNTITKPNMEQKLTHKHKTVAKRNRKVFKVARRKISLFSCFDSLERLIIRNCKLLTKIILGPNIKTVHLQNLPFLSVIDNLTNKVKLTIMNCPQYSSI
ncbi:hypothetical protein EIN_476130 [Entamoeba invadens IP1]|uniref:Uncharacterized protein n=1 Tax=Entamoeba invadens IP1 TaxID=370355 RepID=A0A0A1U413_ENTIV|nr:hypothetical protein EIN_476130 [Entamoeba invadens IP1]ELP88901.1 hypothetical protein EIN_476130 [Entamoeba invadens IP1]|eukprot:XP_004255672.1 hypothetical protein EIN_476130 [Entamoeba invadens IP1]